MSVVLCLNSHSDDNVSVVFTNTQCSCRSLARQWWNRHSLSQVPVTCRHIDARSLVFVPNAVMHSSLAGELKSSPSALRTPSEKQLALRFSVFLPLLFAHLFTNVDNF